MINIKQLLSHINLGAYGLTATAPCASKNPPISRAFIAMASLVLLGVSNTALAEGSGDSTATTQPSTGCTNQYDEFRHHLEILSPSDFYAKYGTPKPPVAEGTNTDVRYDFTDDGNCNYFGYTVHTWDTTVTSANGGSIEVEDEGGVNKIFHEDPDPERNNNINNGYFPMDSIMRDRDYVVRLSQETINNINKGVIAYDSIAPTYNRLDRLEDDYRASTAGIAAMANIPQVTRAGANLIGIGVGHFKGESAVAVGFSATSDNEAFVFKLSAGANTQDDLSVGSSIGYQW